MPGSDVPALLDDPPKAAGMHREYHPDDMRHRRAHAFEPGEHDDHAHHAHRALFAFTAFLGLLIGADLLLGWLGGTAWQSPWGISWIWLAALAGAARIVYGALEALFAGRIGADFALAQACLAALVLGEPFVAAEVVFIAMVGEVLEAITADRALRSIGRLFEQTPRVARVRRDGIEVELPIGQVVARDVVVVGAGERIPVDGPVLAGRSTVDQSALTGESMPVDKGPGDEAFTGTVNQYGRLEVRAEKVGHDSTLGQVLRLVAEAQHRKAPLERAADRYARWFLPVVEIAAAVTLLAGYVLGWPDVWQRVVAILVVACPCALVLATPAAIMASMAWLARHGIVIKGGVALERLAACDTLAFDKTGTLTLGRPEVASIVPLGDHDEPAVLRLAATAEQASRHPVAEAVVRAAQERGIEPNPVSEAEALPGVGVSARIEAESGGSQAVLIGNRRLLEEQGITLGDAAHTALEALDASGETPALLAIDGEVVGLIGVRDMVRREAHDVIHDLKHLKFREVALLTGDRASAARVVAKRVHLKTVESELLPADKATWIASRQGEGRRVAMVGDGINDAPALARADVGIAIGGPGADLAAEAGDVVILGDPLRNLPDLVRLSRSTVAIIRQNILIFAFGLNAFAMGSAALGILGPVPAAILHQAGSLLVLLNAMRLLAFGDWSRLAPFRWLRELGAAIGRLDEQFDPGRAITAVGSRWRWGLAALVVVGVGAVATSGWTVIGPDEVGLLRRNGRFLGVLGPGLYLRWPWPIEQVTRLAPERLRSVEIGFRTGGTEPSEAIRWESAHDRSLSVRAEDEALVLTGDGQLVELTAVAQYQLDASPAGLRRYAFGFANAEVALRILAESAVRSVVGRMSLDRLLTTDRGQAERAVADELRRRVAADGLGLTIRAVAIQEVHPPLEVVDAYRDVSRAQSERQTKINQGLAYRDDQLGRANGKSAALLADAEASRASVIARAEGTAAAFQSRVEARAGAPALSDARRFWETLEAGLASRPKLILDDAVAGARRHLILPEFGPGKIDDPATAAALAPPTGSREEPERADR